MEKTPEQLVREQLEQGTPRAWNWDEDGNTCVGRVVGGFMGHTKFGPRKVLTLDVEGELRSVWLSTVALDDQVVKLDPQVGDVLGIKRGSEKKMGGGGTEYWPFIATNYGATGSSLGWTESAALPPAEEVVQGEVVQEGQPMAYPPTGIQEPPMGGSGDLYDPGVEHATWR